MENIYKFYINQSVSNDLSHEPFYINFTETCISAVDSDTLEHAANFVINMGGENGT